MLNIPHFPARFFFWEFSFTLRNKELGFCSNREIVKNMQCNDDQVKKYAAKKMLKIGIGMENNE